MRKVIVYQWRLNGKKQYEKNQPERVEDGTALFHAWGLECEVGSYTMAIVERKDGTIEMIAHDMIKFIE